MIGCLRTRVKQTIIALYFESENELKFYSLEACLSIKYDKWQSLVAILPITWLFAYCKGGNFNIHIWA